VNVGGGRKCSLSLCETTAICEELTGNRLAVSASGDTRPGDIPVYLSDCARLFGASSWRPQRDAREVLTDTYQWVMENEAQIAGAL
jgi:CDP-paratose 2-epimerase